MDNLFVDEKIKEALILFCKTEGYNACDVKGWYNANGLLFKKRDTDKQIADRVEYFISHILNK
jgi:hypothetical protein